MMHPITKIRRHKIYLIGLLLFFIFSSVSIGQADVKNPFQFKATVIPAEIVPGGKATVEVAVTIAKGHYLYSNKTDITPDRIDGLWFGKVDKPEGVKKNDPYLGTVYTYDKYVVLRLPMRVAASQETGAGSLSLTITYQGCTATACFPPESKPIKVAYTVVASGETVKPAEEKSPQTDNQSEKSDIDAWKAAPDNRSAIEKAADRFGVIGVLMAAFIWGLLASLTPCVYPMIPITVSVIGAGADGKASRGFVLSVFYVLGMSLTYAIFGVAAAWSGNLFGVYTDHPAVRIVVAGVFVILALGMFDVFYLQMPASISSKFGGKTGTGVIGVFITGAVAGAIVGPCVGPMLVGILVYIASLADKFLGFFIMWSFALGMGMLFLVIGTFSGAAASLPKAGKWMEQIKNVFGVLMLAFALYYIQPLLPIKVFYLILGAMLIGISLYLGALDAFTAQGTGNHRLWQAAGIVCLVLGVCYTAHFTFDEQLPRQSIMAAQRSGMTWQNDETDALAKAEREKKPVMIDFAADWCSACKKLEHETFTHQDIIAESARFVNLKIDCTDAQDPQVKQLQQKYHVVGLPTLFFIDSEGKPLTDQSITQFVPPEMLLKRMRSIN
jgi:thiol:disulfide interchange protein DsbD